MIDYASLHLISSHFVLCYAMLYCAMLWYANRLIDRSIDACSMVSNVTQDRTNSDIQKHTCTSKDRLAYDLSLSLSVSV